MFRYSYRLWWLCLFMYHIPSGSSAQPTTDSGFSRQDHLPVKVKEKAVNIIAGLQHGFIFAHSPAVENTKGAHPSGVELAIAWQKNNPRAWNLCNCFPQTGFVFRYYDYDTEVLGQSLGVNYFLEPLYRLGRNTFFSFKGSAGLAYLTNPFDSIRNPANQSYSNAVSGSLVIGAGIWIKLNDHWRLNGTINYQHVSNGGLKRPNKGINYPTGGIAISYQRTPMSYYTGIRSREKFWKNDPLRWDAGIFGMALKETDKNGISHRRPMIGFSLQASRQVGRINALTAGIEILNDKALRTRLNKDSIDASAVRAGLLVGHEFLLGRFLFSQRLGVYIFNQTPYYNRIYHRWGIHYLINKNWGAGLHLKVHRHIADFVDLRITYSWQARRRKE